MKLPSKGITRKQVISKMKELKSSDANWREGRTFSLVYFADDETLELLKEAYNMFFSENGLSPLAFKSLKTFEVEVISMTANMLGGGADAVGSMTSCGTESILLAVKTARDKALAERPNITEPNMVLPITAHPAFEKAAHYFCVKPIHIPVTKDFTADVEVAKELVNDNTVLMVGSAPSYPHGVIDPIPELAKIAKAKGICFHVDACLGGFILPWLKKLGYDIPDFDLRVDGVTSISADLHKYGFAAKGASTIIYKDDSIRKYQYFAYADWPGGLYGSPTILGTRPGGAIAAAWAVMNYLGEEGYIKLAQKIMDITKRLIDGIKRIPQLKILGEPKASVFAFTSDEINIYALGEAMANRGWFLDRQQLPPSLHMMITPVHEKIVEPFLKDLRECVDEVKSSDASELSGMAAIYGMVGAMPERGIAKELIIDFLSQTYRLSNEENRG